MSLQKKGLKRIGANDSLQPQACDLAILIYNLPRHHNVSATHADTRSSSYQNYVSDCVLRGRRLLLWFTRQRASLIHYLAIWFLRIWCRKPWLISKRPPGLHFKSCPSSSLKISISTNNGNTSNLMVVMNATGPFLMRVVQTKR